MRKEFDVEAFYQKRLEQCAKELTGNQEANDKGILMDFKVLTMKDERVCEICATHQGIKMSVTKAEIGVNHPPFHKGCRCLAIYSMEGIVPQNR